MPRTAIDILIWLTNQAYEGDPGQSLLGSLRDLRDPDWTSLPPGGGRSISDILEHIGWAKWMYEDYAFGPATLRGDIPPLIPPGALLPDPAKSFSPGLSKATGDG